MATEVVKIIDPDGGTGYHYLSGNAWESAEEGDLTGVRDEIAIAKCRTTSGSADTSVVSIVGWTTSATQYIKYWTDPTESYRSTTAKYDTSKYRIERSDGDQFFVQEEYVEIDGIQMKSVATTDSGAHVINIYHNTGVSASNLCTIHNCILVGSFTSSGGGYGLRAGSQGNSNWNIDFYNNIVYDFVNSTNTMYGVYPEYVTTFNIYNCTFHNCYRAIYSTSNKTLATNVIIQDCINDGFYGTFNTNSDYNASDISSDAPGSNSQTGEVTFANESIDDFKLDSTDTVAIENGDDLSSIFTDDILGNTRVGWDIGAHEYSISTLDPDNDALAFGEESPSSGENPISWATWSDGAAGSPTISGDADWGKLQLEVSALAQSAVYDMGSSQTRTITLTRDLYGTGSGTVSLYIRGHDSTSFNQDDASPSWELYTVPVNKTWRYIQVRAVE